MKNIIKVTKQIVIAILIYLSFFIVFNIFPEFSNPYITAITNLFLVSLTITIIIYLRNKFLSEKMKCKNFRLNLIKILSYTLISFSLTLFVLYLYSLINPFKTEYLIKINYIDVFIKIFTPSACSVLIAVVLEELLFRYYIFIIMIRHKINVSFSVLISSIIFSVFHFYTYDFYIMTYIVLIGISFALIYLLTGNLGAPIGVHFTINHLADLYNNNEEIKYDSFYDMFSNNESLNIILISILILWLFNKFLFKRKSILLREFNLNN